MLAPRWLQELACRASMSGKVQDPIVRVVSHLLRMIEGVDIRLVVPLCA